MGFNDVANYATSLVGVILFYFISLLLLLFYLSVDTNDGDTRLQAQVLTSEVVLGIWAVSKQNIPYFSMVDRNTHAHG